MEATSLPGTMTLNTYLHNQGLSRRQIEVTNEICKGITNKEIANNLFVTDKTIKFHITNVFKTLGVKSRAELIVRVANLKVTNKLN